MKQYTVGHTEVKACGVGGYDGVEAGIRKECQKIASTVPDKVFVTDGDRYVCNAKSILGCLAAMEWDNIYAQSEFDIYSRMEAFAE